MAGQSYEGFDRKKGNFLYLTYFSPWMRGYFFDTRCHDKLILIHEIKKMALTGKTVEKTPHFWP